LGADHSNAQDESEQGRKENFHLGGKSREFSGGCNGRGRGERGLRML